MIFSILIGFLTMLIAESVMYQYYKSQQVHNIDSYMMQYNGYFSILFLVIVIVLFFLLSRKIIKRIERINEKVTHIANGELNQLTQDLHNDELSSLNANINHMATTIQNSMTKQQEMVCNIAHDLRTPVTSIRGYVKLLQKQEVLSETGQNYASIIDHKTEELSEQINELLDYSIMRFQEKNYEMTEISLSQLLEQVVIDFIPTLEKEQITYELSGNQTTYPYCGNQLLLARLFDNLITNAIRYGKKKRFILLTISEEMNGTNEEYVIKITNDGSCITENDLTHVFDLFYQAESDNMSSPGKGLGLAIAKEIVEIHQGCILVEKDNISNNVSFVVRLTKNRN